MNLEQKKELEQAIHNLKQIFPTGIISIDNERDEKIVRLEKLLKELYGEKREVL